ncbi:MAG TPA: hypothetical protein VME67_23385 [Mycobacterium sp.]|nr:hypothetical protein [Mycobacterium sp.]HTX97514.1 hypothetical protein [Mycobacterium sp.]
MSWFSWLTAVGEIGAGLLVGLRARRRCPVVKDAAPILGGNA